MGLRSRGHDALKARTCLLGGRSIGLSVLGSRFRGVACFRAGRKWIMCSIVDHECLKLVRKVFILEAYYDFDVDQGQAAVAALREL